MMETTEKGVLLRRENERLKTLKDRIAGIKKSLGVMLEKVKKFEVHKLIIAEYETIVIEGHIALTKVEISLVEIEEYILACTQVPDPDEYFLDRLFERVEKRVADAESSWVLGLQKMADEAEENYYAILMASLNQTTQAM